MYMYIYFVFFFSSLQQTLEEGKRKTGGTATRRQHVSMRVPWVLMVVVVVVAAHEAEGHFLETRGEPATEAPAAASSPAKSETYLRNFTMPGITPRVVSCAPELLEHEGADE